MRVLTAVQWLLVAGAATSVVLTTVTHVVAARWRRRHPPACPGDAEEALPTGTRALGTLREVFALTLVLLATPLAPFRVRRAASASRSPLVLVHGPLPLALPVLPLVHALRRAGWRTIVRAPRTPLRGDLDRAAIRLGATLDAVRRQTGCATVDVVAHGVGGLVARRCLRVRGRTSGVAHLVTLGTPHQGSITLGYLVPIARPGSSALEALAADDPVPALVNATAISSPDDPLLVPSEGGYWRGALNVQIRGIAHLSLLFARAVQALVLEGLESAPPAAVPVRARS